ncbi:antA/AntB antirepressor family protein [Ferrovum sp.]|uniref:antA/AntB antirepressor family protein n=1 Tax=Ferrovum sp. TaxID=2609467 RepID=UPI00261A6287|nr:antA/AntB antirepressor family protein [Ferrovum sp.]
MHEFLKVRKDFSTWIKDRIKKYGFEESQDFVGFSDSGNNLNGFPQNGGKPLGGRPAKEYAITLGLACAATASSLPAPHPRRFLNKGWPVALSSSKPRRADGTYILTIGTAQF